MDTSIKRYLWRNLKDKAYRDRFVEANIRNALAMQIRAMRDDRQWTQSELGERAGMVQERISRLEDLDYGSPSLSTLKRVALAFDVGLLVRFVPFSELVNWSLRLTREGFSVTSFDDDHIPDDQTLELSTPLSTGESLPAITTESSYERIDIMSTTNITYLDDYRQQGAHTAEPIVYQQEYVVQR